MFELRMHVGLGNRPKQTQVPAPDRRLPLSHLSRRFQDEENRAREALPAFRLRPLLRAPVLGERVVLRAPVVVGDPPLGLDEAALLHAMERGVERALFY